MEVQEWLRGLAILCVVVGLGVLLIAVTSKINAEDPHE